VGEYLCFADREPGRFSENRQDLKRLRDTDQRKFEDKIIEKWGKESADPCVWWAARAHKQDRIRIHYSVWRERWWVFAEYEFCPGRLFEEHSAMRAEAMRASWDSDHGPDESSDLESWDSTDEKSWRVIDALFNGPIHHNARCLWTLSSIDLIKLFPVNILNELKTKGLQRFLEGSSRKK